MNLPEAEETLCAAIATGAVTSVEPELRVVLAACRQRGRQIADLRVRLRLAHDKLASRSRAQSPIQHDVALEQELFYAEWCDQQGIERRAS